jgi:hypothetical protein
MLIGEDMIADFIAVGRSTVIRTDLDPYRDVGAVAKKIAEDARAIFEWYLNFKGGTKACEEATRAIFDIQLGPVGCANSLREKLALVLKRDGRSFLQARSRAVLRVYAAELLGRDTDRNRYKLVSELAEMEREALANRTLHRCTRCKHDFKPGDFENHACVSNARSGDRRRLLQRLLKSRGCAREYYRAELAKLKPGPRDTQLVDVGHGDGFQEAS